MLQAVLILWLCFIFILVMTFFADTSWFLILKEKSPTNIYIRSTFVLWTNDAVSSSTQLPEIEKDAFV